MNRKFISKGFSLLLVLSLVLALFSGCSSKTNENASDEKKDDKPKATADAPGWESNKEPITFDWYVNFSWFAHKWGDDVVSKYVTDKTGVSINYISPAGNEAEKMNTMIASGKLPDFITLGWWEDAVKKMVEGELEIGRAHV